MLRFPIYILLVVATIFCFSQVSQALKKDPADIRLMKRSPIAPWLWFKKKGMFGQKKFKS